MGKYHPHGDSSIYEALVVMAQDFKKGMPLVDGHGNFGSIEGDGAAAMRYTEARLQQITQEAFLADLDKNVVDFVPNFDETEKEPEVLPVRIPNLLVNGAEGIAVGMATSIPPHNLGEVIDAVKAYMEDSLISDEQLLRIIKGPDFPTGGIVINKDELPEIYKNGMGKIRLRGKVEVEKGKNGKDKLVITEIPYTMMGAGIGKFLNDIATLVESKKTTDIVDITNESDKAGIRIVLELKKNADVENLKNMLYKKTKLEDTFGFNMLAVANGKPETLSLKQVIRHHVEFQYELAARKYTTLLNKEREKSEIQEGLIRACDVIDLIIEIIRGSKTLKEVKACLVNGDTGNIKFKSAESKKLAAELRFTENQAKAILEMRLHSLIGLEIEALIKEHETTLANIALYEKILTDRRTMTGVIVKELDDWKARYSRPRRTVIENGEEAVFEEKKIEEKEIVVLIDRFGYAKTIDISAYERNKEAADGENKHIIRCMNTDKLCIFTDDGKLHQLKVLDLPHGKFRDKGTPMDNVCNYDSGEENIVYIESMAFVKSHRLLFTSKLAMMKVVDGAEMEAAKKTIAATKLADGDLLLAITPIGLDRETIVTDDEGNEQIVMEPAGTEYIVLHTKQDVFLRFLAEEIPEKKKGAVGVRGMKLGTKDELTAIYILQEGDAQVVDIGKKEVHLNRLKIAKRDTKGSKAR